MKFLILVSCFGPSNFAFVSAWKRFFDHIMPLFDVVFVNNNFDPKQFNPLVQSYESFEVIWPKVSVPFDTHSAFLSIKAYADKYDYIIRVDHDAFPSSNFFNQIISFLQNNPEIDFMSASNFCRSIYFGNEILNEVYKSSKDCTWLPWGFPTVNGDIFVIRTKFFKDCLAFYKNDSKIIERSKSKDDSPFATNYLSYKEICQLLKYEISNLADLPISIDGPINSDFWTYMCTNKMKMAGIIDIGGSFQNKNYALMFAKAMQFNSWQEVKDEVDVSFPHKKNIIAPYFHLGNGYLATAYFQNREIQANALANAVAQLQSDQYGFYAVHFSIVHFLTKLLDDKNQLTMLENFINETVANREKFDEFYEKVIAFYKPAMEEYV